MITKIKSESIEFEKKIQNLCRLPYYHHPKGCPNFGKKDGCPPNQLLIDKILDFDKELYLIYTEFNVREFAERIKQMYPEWNERQCHNPRYWQPKARKIQREEENKAKETLNLTKIINSPEAHGVNVSELMKKAGIILEWIWPPENSSIYLVSMGGYSLE